MPVIIPWQGKTSILGTAAVEQSCSGALSHCRACPKAAAPWGEELGMKLGSSCRDGLLLRQGAELQCHSTGCSRGMGTAATELRQYK